MKVSAAIVAACTCIALLAAAGCGGSPPPPRTPEPAPAVTLSAAEQDVWAPLPPDRSAIPAVVYHGIGAPGDFAHPADAEYGVGTQDFARQLTMMAHAGYQTVTLDTFARFVHGAKVDLPARPLLLTFDDGRADSWTRSDALLQKLGFHAIMFVDVGPVERHDRAYLTWDELRIMQQSGRWDIQLHAGPDGHQFIRYDSNPDHTGPYYAYRKQGESFDHWQRRVRSDIERGQKILSRNIPEAVPLGFALPYGAYGQEGTNDERIPGDLLGWLTQQYQAVFTQDKNARSYPGEPQPYGRIQVTRATTGGDLHDMLLSGKQ